MSGSKRVTVDEAEWQEAYAAAARLRDVNRELPGMLDTLRRQQAEQIARLTAQAQARQEQLEQALAGLSDQTKRLEAQTTRRIRERVALLWSDMRKEATELRRDARRQLDEQERRFQAAISQERTERGEEAAKLQQQISDVRKDREQSLADARALAADARLLYQAIGANLPHERFAPGRLAALATRLAVAESDIGKGRGEAAIAQLQEMRLNLGELRAEVELRDAEWQAAQITAMQATTVLLEQIRINARLDVADADGNVLPDSVLDVDFWSDGELGDLQAEVAELAESAASQTDPPSLETLRSIAATRTPELDAQLTDIVGRARQRQIASQIRVNLAEMVVSALEDCTGFVWQEGAAIYAGQDPRNAFYSKLKHTDDSEIVVEVAPDEDNKSCVLRVLSYDANTPDEEERVSRFHAIADSLRQQGLEVSDPAADPGAPDPRLTDFKALGHQAGAPRRRSVAGGAGRVGQAAR